MSRKEVAPAGGEGAEGSSLLATEAGGGGGGELAEALARRRLYREVTLALRTGLRDAKADFSFLRARGLRSLLGFLRSTASAPDDSPLLLFRHSQSIPDLQVIPILFQNSLHQPKEDPVVTLDHIFGDEPMKITSPSTNTEIALALRVLEGCCLLYSQCTALAHKYKAVKVLLNILASRGPTEQGVCLDALISLMLDSPSNQIDFEEVAPVGDHEKALVEREARQFREMAQQKQMYDDQMIESLQWVITRFDMPCGEFEVSSKRAVSETSEDDRDRR